MSTPRPAIPPVLGVLAGAGLLLFLIPFVGLVARIDWSQLPRDLNSDVVRDALWISLTSSVAAAGLATLLGVPLAWLLSRVAFRGRNLVRAIVTLPLVLPPVVGGAALLFALGRRGVVGGPIDDALGVVLPFTWWGVVVANTFVAMPFLVLAVEGALASRDGRHEAAAASLGARPLTIFRRVTLPSIAPALAAGIVLTWARALGEFGATVTFAGNLQGRTQTLPLAVSVALDSGDRDAAVAMSVVMMVVSLVVLLVMRRRWWPVR